jgi:hypothetical protein
MQDILNMQQLSLLPKSIEWISKGVFCVNAG